MIKNGAAHCPTNNAQLFFPENFRIADATMAPTASPRYTLDGAPDVIASIDPVIRSSETCPCSTLDCILLLLMMILIAVFGCCRQCLRNENVGKIASCLINAGTPLLKVLPADRSSFAR